MNTSPDFAAHCLDPFAGLGAVEARSMFGGHAFFVGPAMIAIGDADEWRLWLKVDAAMEDGEAMLPWARLAPEAAERAAAKRRPRRPGVRRGAGRRGTK